MFDCAVQIYCPEMAQTEDIERMVNTIESMINVVDVQIVSTPQDLHSETYQVIIKEVPLQVAKKLRKNDKE